MTKVSILFSILLFPFLFEVSGQNTYSGSFNTKNFTGSATYNYLNDSQSDERIFNDKFRFKSDNGALAIIGNYKEDLKEGPWQIYLSNAETSDILMKYVISASVVGNFTKGNLDGKWQMDRTKIISFNNNDIANIYKTQFQSLSYLLNGEEINFSKTIKISEELTTYFNKNRFAEEFNYQVNNGNSKISGHFDKNGYFHGEWILKFYDNNIRKTQIRTYYHGVLQTVSITDHSTGSISKVYDKVSEVQEFFINYNQTENYSKVGDDFLMLKNGKSKSSDGEFLEQAISNWLPVSDLSQSSYIYEIERGSHKINYYPERIIVENKVKVREFEKLAFENKQAKQLIKKQEEEAERKELNKRREFLRSDYGLIQRGIKNEVNDWLLKGTYESEQDYNERLEKEGSNILKSISKKIINKSKKKALGRIGTGLEPYNVETGTFNIIYGKKETDKISIEISKEIAQQVYVNFRKDREEYYSEIVIMPIKVEMIDNFWKITEALILFDAYFRPPGKALKGDLQISNNGPQKFQGFWNSYGKAHLKNLINIKTTKSIENEIYFYEWKSSDYRNEQSMSFSFEDLEIDFSN